MISLSLSLSSLSLIGVVIMSEIGIFFFLTKQIQNDFSFQCTTVFMYLVEVRMSLDLGNANIGENAMP